MCLIKLISAPSATRARPSPIIKSSNGEKLLICVLALAIKSVTKSTGNSIINGRFEGQNPLSGVNYYFAVFIIKFLTKFAIANARNTPMTELMSGIKAVMAPVTYVVYMVMSEPFTVIIQNKIVFSYFRPPIERRINETT